MGLVFLDCWVGIKKILKFCVVICLLVLCLLFFVVVFEFLFFVVSIFFFRFYWVV